VIERVCDREGEGERSVKKRRKKKKKREEMWPVI
jgi:hypothetical protein